MKKRITMLLSCLLCLAVVWGSALSAAAVSYSEVAGADEMTTVEQVGIPGMEPISGKDVKDGVYDVEVESSSSMFRIEQAVLTVKDGEMTADLTLSGTSYSKLFPGTGAQAAKSNLSDYIDFTEHDGKYTYTFPVEALDKPLPCAAFSKRKEKWYDRSLLFQAKSLPAGAVLVELPDYEALESAAMEQRIEAMRQSSAPSQTTSDENIPSENTAGLEDGDYTVSADLSGGTGRATIATPVPLTQRDGVLTATIQWSSSHYDYMKVNGQKYLPTNTEGNATFEIPVTGLEKDGDTTLEVIADTTAMSTPHEITYTLTFHGSTITPVSESSGSSSAVVGWIILAASGGCIVAIAAIVLVLCLRKRNG